MDYAEDFIPKKRGQKIRFDDELHRAWRVASQHGYQLRKTKRKIK